MDSVDPSVPDPAELPHLTNADVLALYRIIDEVDRLARRDAYAATMKAAKTIDALSNKKARKTAASWAADRWPGV
ncbi:hypothetical protein [Actinopolyspora halophila]|uniref:hypothetical protein n=1 Tax=Actinopolyspora halophila TaxID=1850 RepID=UPI00036207BE|nr:hypothetical protein [Actinopolyspora halophila]